MCVCACVSVHTYLCVHACECRNPSLLNCAYFPVELCILCKYVCHQSLTPPSMPSFLRPITPLPGDTLTLQDWEPNCSRFAQFCKLRTITTRKNSIKQTPKSIYPVRMGPILGGERLGPPEEEAAEAMEEELQGDVLWCTEMERLVTTW